MYPDKSPKYCLHRLLQLSSAVVYYCFSKTVQSCSTTSETVQLCGTTSGYEVVQYTSESWTVRDSNENKMADHSKPGSKSPGFKWLDRFVYSNHLKAGLCPGFGFDFWRLSDLSGFRMAGPFYIYVYIYSYIQQSSLNRPSCFSHSKVWHKKRPRDYHLKAGRSGFRMPTVFWS
jgi:hypothetical protein